MAPLGPWILSFWPLCIPFASWRIWPIIWATGQQLTHRAQGFPKAWESVQHGLWNFRTVRCGVWRVSGVMGRLLLQQLFGRRCFRVSRQLAASAWYVQAFLLPLELHWCPEINVTLDVDFAGAASGQPGLENACACTYTSNPSHPLPSRPPSHWHANPVSICLGCAPTQGGPIFTDWWGLGAGGATPRMGSCCWACVAMQFFSHDARHSTSPHSDLGMPLSWVNAQICSKSMWFNRSAMLFHCRVSWVVSFLAVLAAARCLSNTMLRYLIKHGWTFHFVQFD